MKSLVILYLFLPVISCIKEHETTSIYNIINNSNHKIKIKLFANEGLQVDSFFIGINQVKEYKEYNKDIVFPFMGLDSVNIIYDDTISIYHGSKLYKVNRSLLFLESFNGGKTIDKKYKHEYNYEYIFTNTDYEEALNLILSN